MGNLNNLRHSRTGDLTDVQITAIKSGLEVARYLQDKYPEIADLYRDGESQAEIACGLNAIDNKFQRGITTEAVGVAIRGYHGGFGVDSFDGLIDDMSELEELARKHRTDGGKKDFQNGSKLFSLTPEEKIKVARKANATLRRLGIGIFGQTRERKAELGRQTYIDKQGVHGRTREKMREDAHKSVRTRGLILWVEREETSEYTKFSETEFAYMLSQSQSYKCDSQVNNKKIARTLNAEYHDGKEIRTGRSVGCALSKYRKIVNG